MWFANGRLAAWGWVHLPYRVARSDGTLLEVKTASLIWQTHPDRPELISEILDWYDDLAGGVDRLLTVHSADLHAQTTVAAHGYAFDAEAGSDDGPWVQFNMRELADVPDPVLPEGYRFLSARDAPAAEAVRAHRDAWHQSSFTEAAFERVRRTWPYRGDLHVLAAAPDGTLGPTADQGRAIARGRASGGDGHQAEGAPDRWRCTHRAGFIRAPPSPTSAPSTSAPHRNFPMMAMSPRT